jgi:hypothetical protein
MTAMPFNWISAGVAPGRHLIDDASHDKYQPSNRAHYV